MLKRYFQNLIFRNLLDQARIFCQLHVCVCVFVCFFIIRDKNNFINWSFINSLSSHTHRGDVGKVDNPLFWFDHWNNGVMGQADNFSVFLSMFKVFIALKINCTYNLDSIKVAHIWWHWKVLIKNLKICHFWSGIFIASYFYTYDFFFSSHIMQMIQYVTN